MLDGAETGCPYCGEELWIAIDLSAGRRQKFISDCEVCCRPIEFEVQIATDGTAAVYAATEDQST